MKKVLFATTALVATAGVAAADVTFGGYGRFGVMYDSQATRTGPGVDGVFNTLDDTYSSSVDITSRFRLQIDATAETDAGVTVGARVRIQQTNGGSGQGINGARFFARSGGLEVGVGNIFGALEYMPGMYPIDLGLTGLGYDYTAFNGRADAYSSSGAGASRRNGVEVIYSMGDFSAHLSASEGVNDRIAAHFAYTTSGWTFALGLQDSNNVADTEWAVSVGGSFGVADVTLAWADNGTAGDHWVLAGKFDVGAATNVEAYVADADYFNNTSFGIDFNHDLGGGVSLRGGVARRGGVVNTRKGETIADLGVRFNF